jgi:hypothetical protein
MARDTIENTPRVSHRKRLYLATNEDEGRDAKKEVQVLIKKRIGEGPGRIYVDE